MDRPQVRVEDPHACPRPGHGTSEVVAGCVNVFVNHLHAARVGDPIACGATITSGEPSVIIGHKPAARLGDNSSHGGVLIAGSPNVFVGKPIPPESEEVVAAIVERPQLPPGMYPFSI